MFVSEICKAFNVKYLSTRVGNSLSEETLRVALKRSLNTFVFPFRINESAVNPHLL